MPVVQSTFTQYRELLDLASNVRIINLTFAIPRSGHNVHASAFESFVRNLLSAFQTTKNSDLKHAEQEIAGDTVVPLGD